MATKKVPGQPKETKMALALREKGLPIEVSNKKLRISLTPDLIAAMTAELYANNGNITKMLAKFGIAKATFYGTWANDEAIEFIKAQADDIYNAMLDDIGRDMVTNPYSEDNMKLLTRPSYFNFWIAQKKARDERYRDKAVQINTQINLSEMEAVQQSAYDITTKLPRVLLGPPAKAS